MATSLQSASPVYQIYPGQAAIGSDVSASNRPMIFAGKTTVTGGLRVGGNIPTVAILAGMGTGVTLAVTNVTGYDQAASFNLVAGGGALNGGSLASVTFGQPLAAAPAAVVVTAAQPAGTFSFAVGAISITKTGFVIGGTGPQLGGTYTVNYWVIGAPTS